ncbi:MAG: N-acetyltransferase [Clostridia bacterium]|nr:N-acetyltransferase [Clostridia bacterium]
MIRAATSADLPRLLEIYAPYVSEETASFEYDPPSLQAFEERFERITAFYPWLVLEEEGMLKGYAYLSRAFERKAYRFLADLSVYIERSEVGKGYGRALVSAIEEIAKRQHICALYAIITAENKGSISFHERMGFSHVATLPDCGYKFGRWLSVVWYEKRLSFGEPQELIAYRDLP